MTTTFATPQELRTLIDGTTLDDDADAEWIAQATLLLEMISGDMQTAARNRIIRTTVTARLAGTWSGDLELPTRPVVSVTSVALNGTPLAGGSFTWNERAVIRSSVPTIGNLGPVELVPGDGAHWGGPVSTVEVVYVAGYTPETVPDWVKAMTLRVAARSIDNVADVTQVSLGPFSESYGSRNGGRTAEAGGVFLTAAERKLLRSRFSRTAGTHRTGSL